MAIALKMAETDPWSSWPATRPWRFTLRNSSPLAWSDTVAFGNGMAYLLRDGAGEMLYFLIGLARGRYGLANIAHASNDRGGRTGARRGLAQFDRAQSAATRVAP